MKSLVWAAALAVAAAVSGPAAAEDWEPSGPIQLLIGFAAGGGADTQARLIAEELENRHGWRITPQQATGRGGLTLAAQLKDAPADGTAIGMIVTETLGYNMVAAGDQVGFSIEDFTPLTTTAGFQMGVVTLTSRGWGDFDDVVAAAQAGEEIRFGAMSPKLADLAYLLGRENGVDFNIVSYRGGRAVVDAINAGDVDLGWGAGIQARAVRDGTMVNLVSGLSRPLDVSPDAPLMSDVGVQFNADGYFMFVAPAGLPDAARERLATAIAEIMNDPETEPNQLVTRAFGGPSVIAGAELDALLATGVAQAEGLLAAASE